MIRLTPFIPEIQPLVPPAMIAPILFSVTCDPGLYATCHSESVLLRQEVGPGGFCIRPGHARFAATGSSRQWPEVFGPADGALILSANAVAVLRASELTGYELHEATFFRIQSEAMALKPIPRYWWLRPLGEVQIDEARLTDVFSSNSLDRTVPVMSTWNGGDFVCVGKPENRVLFCSRKFLNLARINKWKYFHFFPMDLDSAFGIKYGPPYNAIDYLGKKWPPDWYPPGVEGDPSNLEEIETL